MKYCVFILSLAFLSCQSSTHKNASVAVASVPNTNQIADASAVELDKYWYQGKAEITRYSLSQKRYRDVHEGQAVLIFVTEDFLTDKQVKNDNYKNPNSIPVLKNNQIKKFPTGIYDYSIMSSIFTPVQTDEYPNTLKVTTSSQEWCGHTYMQVNLNGLQYKSTIHSYFENEADQVQQMDVALLEDEIFNRIRINPDALPTGQIKIIPSTQYARLKHKDAKPLRAKATNDLYQGNDFEGKQLKSYKISYDDIIRDLEIIYEYQPPYKIVGWKEGETIAKRTHERMSAYWQENSKSDQGLRSELGLDSAF